MTEITRQHLEDAALAAGFKYRVIHLGGQDYRVTIDGREWWRPHLDDGDSRRLQIAVRMSLVVGGSSAAAGLGLQYARLVRHDGTPDDAARAAREAVVLCAAEVGKRMREEGS